ncbi:MAG: hypothetical protein CMJ76_01085 [Planctomycetaceae bacterium]|nr:hypothetical protein [Planctomycetaceae bacterium]|tara:strand:+ start:2644 stop:3024 length:381 start_codon:yes stop_codon:yes gene_type:complete
MQEISPGWTVDSHHQGDWLCLTLDVPVDDIADTPVDLAELIDVIVRRSFFMRVIVNLELILYLPARLMRQLILLKDKIEQRGGRLALCAMTEKAYQSVTALGLEQTFPNYKGVGSVTASFRPVNPR